MSEAVFGLLSAFTSLDPRLQLRGNSTFKKVTGHTKWYIELRVRDGQVMMALDVLGDMLCRIIHSARVGFDQVLASAGSRSTVAISWWARFAFLTILVIGEHSLTAFMTLGMSESSPLKKCQASLLVKT